MNYGKAEETGIMKLEWENESDSLVTSPASERSFLPPNLTGPTPWTVPVRENQHGGQGRNTLQTFSESLDESFQGEVFILSLCREIRRGRIKNKGQTSLVHKSKRW